MMDGFVWSALLGHSMRGYYVPILAGTMLVVSAFLPWILIDGTPNGGVPDMGGLWILGLGVAAVVLASLSIVTRKNSRHPILVVGLIALGILFLAYQVTSRSVTERAWVASQAVAIVEGVAAPPPPKATIGSGLYLGWAASAILTLFGLTIVVTRVSQPYALTEDDDV